METRAMFRNFVVTLFCLAQINISAQQKEVKFLSGKDNKSSVTWDFFCTDGRQSGYWTSIIVPSCWEQQGFGNYDYGRDYKTNGKNFRFSDEKGLYRLNFSIPENWRNKEIFLVFEGSMTDTYVKINGIPAGKTHQGAFYQFKYNITDKVKLSAQNLLEVTVSKMSSDASVNNAERLADYWIFGGIFRPVYLEALPSEHVENVSIDAKANGTFSALVVVKNPKKANALVAIISDNDGNKVSTLKVPLTKADTIAQLQTKVKNVNQWTNETPNLYSITINLMHDQDILYSSTQKFGFRTIEIRKGDGVYLNGIQIKMKGVNRHAWWPETGRTLNDEINLNDIKLIRSMNMNAVRCSHYPPDQHFLDLCDSLGLYVIDELAGWQKAYNTTVGESLVKEMVQRDVNHPSVIFWANGNEGGTNKELDDDFLRWDYSHRPVIHPHHRPGNSFNGIDCNHYEDYYSTEKILNDSLIYMPTEFLHSQDDGGGGAGMHDFWELHWNSKRSGGGFIWALLDEGLVRTDLNNIIDTNGLNANDGILGPHREKEASYYSLREIFSPVKIETKNLPPDFNGEIPVSNRYHFTSLKDCIFKWALIKYRNPFTKLTGYTVKKKGVIASPSISPGSKGIIKINLPVDYRNNDALILVAYDSKHNEINRSVWQIRSNDKLISDFITTSDSLVSKIENDTSYILKASGMTIQFDKKNGEIEQIRNISSGYNLSFNNGPALTQGLHRVVSSEIMTEKYGLTIKFKHDGPMIYTKWKILSNGWISLEYEYNLTGLQSFAGISFNYPENYILGVKWLGRGPYRQWKNRMHGTTLNVWQNLYNNTQTGYAPFIYPEFKGYYGDVVWMEFRTTEGKFYVASPDAGLNVRLFEFYGLTGVKNLPALPSGNISFLDCIPPIGTKLAMNVNADTKSLGPDSELTKLNKTTRRTLYFYFGIPPTEQNEEVYSRPEIDEVF